MTEEYPKLAIKPGREASIGFHHPWIFSGAFVELPNKLKHGSLVHVTDRRGHVIGTGTFSANSSISVRLLAFSEVTITQAWMNEKIQTAYDKRLLLGYGPNTATTGYRLVFSEADELPGLVVDMYNDVVVIQISTAGMEALKPLVLIAMKEIVKPVAIVERLDVEARRPEKLELGTYKKHGRVESPIHFQENGVQFVADVLTGQKTGFFLDQKESRQAVAKYANGKEVLNLFSYTGASAVVALKNGAKSVHNVDLSQEALDLVAINLKENNLKPNKVTNEQSDVFNWLGQDRSDHYDMVLMDPPALVKTRAQKDAALKAYHFINRAAMRLVKDKGIFITSSCSRHLFEEDLAFVLRRAAVQNNMRISLLHVIRQSADHPLSVYFPESSYLKTFVCQIFRA